MKTKTDVNHFLFLAAYLIGMTDAMLFGLSTYGQVRHASLISWVLRIAAAALIFLKLFLDRKYTLHSLLYSILSGALVLVSFLLSGYNHIFYLMLIVLGMRHINVRTAVQADFMARLVLIALIMLSAAFGLIENYVTYRTGTLDYRYSLGFVHPNTFASLVLIILLEEAWLKRRRFSLLYALLIWLLSAVVYVITLNRTSVLLMAIYPVLLLLFTRKGRAFTVSRRLCIAAMLAFPAIVAFSLITMELCGSSALFSLLNRLMSNRFANCAVLFERYGIPLLGQKVELVSMKYARQHHVSMALLDVAYLRTLLQNGPLVLALMGVIHMRATADAAAGKDRLTILILLTFLLFGFSESLYNNVYMNFSLLMGAAAVYTPLESPARPAQQRRIHRPQRNPHAKKSQI